MRTSPAALRPLSVLLSCGLLATLLVALGSSSSTMTDDVEQASSGSTYLCWGYAGCRDRGYSDGGYGAVNDRSYWNMYPGHNCTNYVAYRMIRAGMSSTRPFGYPGNATNWGEHMAHLVDQTPHPMAVAWWRAHDGGHGSAGHVAIVERVAADHIIISEDSWGGTFTWRRINRTSSRWPTGFIHFVSRVVENTQRPEISGSAKLGEVLRVNDGAWNTDINRYGYVWWVGGERTDVSTPTFTVGPEHVGQRIQARVVARKPGWTNGRRNTTRTRAARPGDISSVTAPTITGTATRGETLAVHVGQFSPQPDRIAVQWLADGEPIPGATKRRLELTRAHVDAHISVDVTAHKDAHADKVVRTAPTDWVRNGYVTTAGTGGVDGTPRVNTTLTAVPGEVKPARGIEVSYQWLRDGAPIEGATQRRYRTTAADHRSRIGVEMTYHHPRRLPATETVAMKRAVMARTAMSTRVLHRGPTGKRIVFRIEVVARNGVDATVQGDVEVSFAGRRQVVRLEDGAARVVFRRVPHGTYRAVVWQQPNDAFVGSRDRLTVEVAHP